MLRRYSRLIGIAKTLFGLMKSDKNKLIINALENITKRNESIAIVGLGYVGLPLALTFAENNFSVIGIDIDQQKNKKVKK